MAEQQSHRAAAVVELAVHLNLDQESESINNHLTTVFLHCLGAADCLRCDRKNVAGEQSGSRKARKEDGDGRSDA